MQQKKYVLSEEEKVKDRLRRGRPQRSQNCGEEFILSCRAESFGLGQGPRAVREYWIPAFAGMTRKRRRVFPKPFSLAGTEGLDKGDDAPAVQGIDGGGKRRLLATGNSIADLFEESAF